ncbi:MAG: threonine ammonia-lyase [Hyphomicrobiales bacterium]
MPHRVPTFDDVNRAAERIAGAARRTSLLEYENLNARAGTRIVIKPELLQRTGSFKFRGAYNRISQLSPETCPGGVVAFSSGNHAQGVAAAAQLKGLPAVIVMPDDAPAIKRANTEGYGATVVAYDRATEDRQAIAEAIAAERGSVLVPSYDDPDIIAGQGTVGLELAQDAADRGLSLDLLLVPCSGGGLVGGINLAFEALSPSTGVFVVEPEGFDDHARSLRSGAREVNSAQTGSICDALLSPQPGEITFEINRRCLKGGFVVSDDEVRAAVAYAFRELKLVVEPGGAVGLAAVLSGKVDAAGRTIGIVLSGGNVDAGQYSTILEAF